MAPDQALVTAASKSGVRFLVIGGTAVNYHAPEGGFDDLDLWLEPTLASAAGFLNAMTGLGGPRVLATPEELARPNKQIREKAFFYLDVLTGPVELHFAEHWERAEEILMAGSTTKVRVASIPTLLALLRLSTSADPKHSRDIALLERELAVNTGQ